MEMPKAWTLNHGAWYWVYLVVILIWSAFSAANGTRAWFESGELLYVAVQWSAGLVGILCLAVWLRARDRHSQRGDRLWQYPETVFAVFSGWSFGVGSLSTEAYRALTLKRSADTIGVLLGVVMIGIGVHTFMRARRRYRSLQRVSRGGNDDHSA